MTQEHIPLAATVVLLRQKEELEVLMVTRHQTMAFMPGALVFPGGKVDPGDTDSEWSLQAIGWDLVPFDERGSRIAAVRETFEETGILVGVSNHFAADRSLLARERKTLDAGKMSFFQFIKKLGVKLDILALKPFARWVTPVGFAKRYDTHFFAVNTTEHHEAVFDGKEITGAEWITASEALRLAETGERYIVLPTKVTLKLLQGAKSFDDAVSRGPRVTFQPRLEIRGAQKFVCLDTSYGLGSVEALLR